MKYTLGVDVGIASVGFAGVNILSQSISFCGVHIFEAAENPKDGASLAAPRREKRGMRRVIGRRAQRKKALRNLFLQFGLSDVEAIDSAPFAPPEQSVWDLRKEALERLLADGELSRILFHIAKRRGFQSNRKGVEDNDTEGKKALSGAIELQEAMVAAAAPTIGAYLATLDKKRNGDGSYERFVTRDLLREEVRQIFEAQTHFGNAKTTPEFLTAYAGSGKKGERNTPEGDGIAFYQRPLKSSEDLVGFCTLEPAEKRAPRFAYTAELFVLWSKLNNARIKSVGGNERELTLDEKNRLAEKAHTLKSLSYKQARKELDLQDEERFNLSYRKISDEDDAWEKIRDTAEKADFLKLPGYHALKNILGGNGDASWQKWTGADRDKLDEIARTLSFYEDKKQVDELLSDLEIDFRQREELAKITHFSKVVDLSLKTIRNILPHMQAGMTYDKACAAAGYDHSRKQNRKLKKVPVFEDVRNPVVNRALAQTRKVINACIREYGMPESIIVEMSRDLGRAFKDRKNIEREQKKNQAYREEARQHIAEIIGGIPDNISGEDILKYRLWKDQKAMCCYCGSEITPVMLKDAVATQIDHILPYSRSWNDSYMNKVICHTSCNQDKANRTPYEWLAGTHAWEGIELFSRQLPPRKAENLLMQNFDDEKAEQWKDRALNDTRYISRLLKNHLAHSLDLGEGVRVQTRNGMLTSNLRGAWGLGKTRENDRHHAVDAIVLACSTQAMVQQHANWNKYAARRQNPAARPLPPSPWENFRHDVMNKVFGEKNAQGIREGGIFVSRMPVRKITGAAHEETVRSIRKSDGKIIQRVKLSSLTPARLEDLVDKDRNIKLYNVLKERLDAHGGKPDKAFAAPVYMPTNDPNKQGPRINAVRVVTSEKSGVPINGGLASNGDMVRVDVFLKEGKYFLVPIYVHHFAQDRLPNKAIFQGKTEDEWPEMDDKDFIFSLYKNDLVRVKKNEKEEFWGYYVGTDRATGNVSFKAHDGSPAFGKDGSKRSGVKTLLAFEKYSVDYFGNIFPKTSPGIREKRRDVAQRDDSKSGAAEPVQRSVATGE